MVLSAGSSAEVLWTVPLPREVGGARPFAAALPLSQITFQKIFKIALFLWYLAGMKILSGPLTFLHKIVLVLIVPYLYTVQNLYGSVKMNV